MILICCLTFCTRVFGGFTHSLIFCVDVLSILKYIRIMIKKNKNIEQIEQAKVVQDCNRLAYEGKYPELALLYAIPNGGLRHIGTAMKLKCEGVKAGVPDLHLPIPRGVYTSLFIEMKAPGGRVSAEQKKWHVDLTKYGRCRVVVCYSYGEAMGEIQEYYHLPTGGKLPLKKKE